MSVRELLEDLLVMGLLGFLASIQHGVVQDVLIGTLTVFFVVEMAHLVVSALTWKLRRRP